MPKFSLGRMFHPLNVGFLTEFDRIGSRDSVREAMRWWMAECRLNLDVQGPPFPESGPLIILSNHHGIFDFPAIWSNLARDDVHFIGMRATSKLGKAIAARHFPVYMSQKPSPYLFERIKNHTYYRIREGIDRAEALRRNRENTSRAAACVREGGCLILFPTAGTYVDTTMWKHGIGHLIAEIDNADLRIVLVHIDGPGRADLLYMLNPYLFFWLRRPRRIRMKTHEPLGIAEFRERETSPREISARLKDRYLEIFGRF